MLELVLLRTPVKLFRCERCQRTEVGPHRRSPPLSCTLPVSEIEANSSLDVLGLYPRRETQ
jgi:hypothetical protein